MKTFGTIFKLIIWGGIIYGLYYIFQLYPLESVIALGIILILIIGYWLYNIE